MRKRTLLGIFVVLLLVGAYATYALNNPKLPEVKGCVNPFREVKPISKTPENWSSVHVFFKVVFSKDIRGLAKPWEIDYKNVKIVKHTLDYNGEKITMLAMALPLKDGKHVIAYYEFSKPVQGVKTRAFLLMVEDKGIKTEYFSTNGIIKPATSCTRECYSDSDCLGYPFQFCYEYCCDTDWSEAPKCCFFACGRSCKNPGSEACIECIITMCPWCLFDACEQWGSTCLDYGNMP